MKSAIKYLLVASLVALLGLGEGAAQKPTKPDTTPKVTKGAATGRSGQSCYQCNTGWVNKGWTTITRTYVLQEYSDICDATCAQCGPSHCTKHPENCPGPRDGGKDSHAITVTGKAALEKAEKLVAEIGGTNKTGGKVGYTGESSGSVSAETEITLGKKNTHAHKGEKLEFYGYVALTVVYRVGSFTKTWADFDLWDESFTWIDSVTLTVKNGYSVIPCDCSGRTSFAPVPTRAGITGATAVAYVSAFEDRTVTVSNPFPLSTVQITSLDAPDEPEQSIPPGESRTLDTTQGIIIGAAAIGTAIALLPDPRSEPPPPLTPAPSIDRIDVGQTPLDQIPVYAGGVTPVLSVHGTMPQDSEVRLLNQFPEEGVTALSPHTFATIAANGSIVQQVLRFEGLDRFQDLQQSSVALVDADGDILAQHEVAFTNAAMTVQLQPETGPAGSETKLIIRTAEYLKTLQMERPRFEAADYDLGIDYSVSGGASGPVRVPIDPSGVNTVQIRRGQVGTFPLIVYLAPKN